jgi:hypothetical protein
MVRSAKVLALSAASLAMITPGAEAFAASSGAPMALRRNNAACAVSMEAVPRMDRRAALPLAAAGLGFALFPREAFAGEPIPMDAKAPDTLEVLHPTPFIPPAPCGEDPRSYRGSRPGRDGMRAALKPWPASGMRMHKDMKTIGPRPRRKRRRRRPSSSVTWLRRRSRPRKRPPGTSLFGCRVWRSRR